MRIFKFFGKKGVSVENLPDLVKKVNQNDLIQYTGSKVKDSKNKDPLYMRIEPEELDYIKEYNKELGLFRKNIFNPLRRLMATKFNFFKFEKELYRPNVNLREPYMGNLSKFTIVSFPVLLATCIFAAYIIGYFWSRLKYDIYTRRWMYQYLFSFMMVFEYIDYQADLILDRLNDILPIEMSDKELEFILYRKFRTYYKKRKLKKEIEGILQTDPELFEIDKLMKKLN